MGFLAAIDYCNITVCHIATFFQLNQTFESFDFNDFTGILTGNN